MEKNRMINTKFWSDNYIEKLGPVEKLLYLYFLTSPMTRISGTYEIPVRNISFDTGIKIQKVEQILSLFEKDEKIYYRKGWIFITNFIKNQKLNPSVTKGIQNELNLLPEKLHKEIALVEPLKTAYDRFYIACDSLSPPVSKGRGKGREEEREEEREGNAIVSTPPPDFEKFWGAYPNKIKKAEAEKVWEEKKIDSKTLKTILDFIGKAKQTDAWKKKFIPSPKKFLEERRWTDDLAGYADYGSSPPGKKKEIDEQNTFKALKAIHTK